MKPSYIIANSGRLSGVFGGKVFSIETDNPNYQAIIKSLREENFTEFEVLLNRATQVEKYTSGLVKIEGNTVTFKGVEVHNVVVEKILEFMDKKLPYKPLVRFLEKLMLNPSMTSRNELYDFLQNGGFPITESGNFLAYKGLRSDYYDIHSGKFLNSVGSSHRMERKDVDDNRRNHCSYGFHVGTHEYASEFSRGALVMVEVNPKDVVSVPEDCSCQKCRVTEYKVIQDCTGKFDGGLVTLHDNVYCEYEDDYEENEEVDIQEDFEDDGYDDDYNWS